MANDNSFWTVDDDGMAQKYTDHGSWIMESTQTAASAVSFSLGERFRSFGELEDKLKRYEKSTFTKFWKRDCRTVEAARRRMDRPLADCITYYEVTYRCIHGGRKFKARGEGKRATM